MKANKRRSNCINVYLLSSAELCGLRLSTLDGRLEKGGRYTRIASIGTFPSVSGMISRVCLELLKF